MKSFRVLLVISIITSQLWDSSIITHQRKFVNKKEQRFFMFSFLPKCVIRKSLMAFFYLCEIFGQLLQTVLRIRGADA